MFSLRESWLYDYFLEPDIDPTGNSLLWNAMIYPLLNTTIYGVIWYQGEKNAVYRTNIYNCTFPAMINGWRKEWFSGTSGATNLSFPFGFVQVRNINYKCMELHTDIFYIHLQVNLSFFLSGVFHEYFSFVGQQEKEDDYSTFFTTFTTHSQISEY